MTGDDEIRVQLARMEGKQDVANERLNSALNDIHDIRKTVHGHGNRIGVLEADKHLRDGERQGIAMTTRVMWAVVGALPTGAIVAIIMKVVA